MNSLKRAITSPIFDDETKTQQAFMLHIILWTLIIVPIPYVIYTFIFIPEDSSRALSQAAFGEIVNIILLIALHRGFVKTASILQACAFWFFFTATAFTGSGVQGEAYLIGYTLVIAIAGMLLGGTGALIFTILSLISGALMVNLQLQGRIGTSFVSSPLSTWIVSFVLFPVGALLQRLSTNRVRSSLSRAHASEERYRLISQISSDYTFSTTIDLAGNMHLDWVAGAFEEITGYTFDEYVATGGWLGHLHPDDLARDAKDTATLKTNKPVIAEMRTFKKGQELRWVRVYANPVWDKTENRLVGIVGAVQDITGQKQAEERDEQRRLLLEKVILISKQVTETHDLQTTLERIWHAVHDDLNFDRLAIFLYDQETDTIHGTLGTDNNGNIVEEWDYVRTLDHEKPTSFMRTLESPEGLYYTDSFSTEFDITDGHEMYNVRDFAAVSAWAGEKPVAIITVDNLPSGRSFTQAQLESLRLFAGYAGLAIENSHLNAALQLELEQRQTLINELENKNAELERFTYTVSHDLKSPLVTITGFLGFLEKDATNGRVGRVKSSITRISNAAKKMQSLLNDLLELSRIGRLMNTPEDVPFEEIIHDAIDHLRGGLDEISAIVEIQREFPIIRGDRVRLVEVVQNLIENAIKYSNPRIQLRIEIGMNGYNEKGCPVFYVRDNGIGIEPQYHEHIFGLFNKLDAQSEGTGIGLSLVKRIIEVHNGHIWVESQIGRGTTFYFSLPASQKKE